MYEGTTRVHFIFAGKCKKSEMLYTTWLNVVGVIPLQLQKENVFTGSKKYCFRTELLHLKQYFLLSVNTFYFMQP